MSRSPVLLAWITAVAWPLLSSVACAAARPNIMFVLTDDQRFDALGCAGNPVIRTPHIDRLAARGVRFDRMFCTTSICAISRASFLTGQYARRHGVQDFAAPLSSEQFAESFPALLRKRGYRTGFIGKWGLGGPLPRDQYDVFEGFSGQGRYFAKGKEDQPGEHLTGKLADQAVGFLDGCTQKQPFVLQVSTKAAHCQDGEARQFPFDSRYANLYIDDEIPLPVTATEADFDALPDFLKTSEARARWKLRFATDEMFQRTVKDYYRLVTGVDDLVGRIVKRLEQRGLAENTIIVFTSDNGFYLGDHGLAGKWFMHEESIRLPLVIYDPRRAATERGRTLHELVLNIDLAPTFCELAGAPIPARMQGRSLVPLLIGDDVEWRTEFFYEHRFPHARIPQTEGIRDDRWKYTRYVSEEPVYEELFDLEADPHEQHNLAGDADHRATLERLRARWQDWRRQVE